MISLSVAPSGLYGILISCPRAARTFSPLTLGYDLTAPTEPLPRWGIVIDLRRSYALTAPTELCYRFVLRLGHNSPGGAETLKGA